MYKIGPQRKRIDMKSLESYIKRKLKLGREECPLSTRFFTKIQHKFNKQLRNKLKIFANNSDFRTRKFAKLCADTI